MIKGKLERVEAKIREAYQGMKEDHSACGKYSKLLEVAREALAAEGETEILVKRLRVVDGELSHSVIWDEDVSKEVLFLVCVGEDFLGCASFKIPVEDRNASDVFEYKEHGDKESRWLRKEYLQEVFF